MKKFILAAIAATTVFAVPASAADRDHRSSYSQRGDHDRNWNKGRAAQGHRWARGQRFDRRYATNYQVISNYRAYRLNAPPRGYRYVRSNNDIVMIAIATGLIGQVFNNAF